MVGDICIVREPNSNGEIEIGYDTHHEFRKKGFMTEAVGGIIKWATSQPKVLSIITSTDKDNIASSTILKKNNFSKVSESETKYDWKLILKNNNPSND